MKKTMKRITKLGMLLFGIVIMSCQKDDTVTDIENTATEVINTSDQAIIKVKTFQELNNNATFVNSFNAFNNSLRNSCNKNNYDIDYSTINEITYNDNISYTFAINSDEYTQGVFENLVIQNYASGATETFILKYTLDELIYFNEHDNHSFKGNIEYIPLTTQNRMRDYVYCFTIYFCDVEYIHVAGPKCLNTWPETFCSRGGGGSGSGSGNSGSGPGGGGGASPSGTPNNPITSPIFKTNYKKAVISCLDLLSNPEPPEVLNCINEWDPNDPRLKAAYRYGEYNNCSPQAQQFAQHALEAECGGGVVDYVDQIIYDDTWDDHPCQKAIVKDALESCSTLTEELLNIFQASDYSNLNFTVTNAISGNGQTSPQSVYNPSTSTCTTTIKIRESYIDNTTDISLARTVIHESVHAILVYLFETGELTSDDGLPLVGYEDLVKAHINYSLDLPANLGKTHHQVMVEYVYKIAVALENYSIAAGHTNSYDYYTKLAWGGLYGSLTFNSLYPQYLNPADASTNPTNYNPAWLDIINTGAAEQDNTTYIFNHQNGTTYTYEKKGNTPNATTPCN